MASLLVEVSDSIVSVLAAAGFMSSATITRSYVPVLPAASDMTLKVFVIPQSMEVGRASTRDSLDVSPIVWVCVVQRIERATQQAEVDSLVELMESTAQLLVGSEQLSVEDVTFDPIYDPGLLDTGVFQGVLSVKVQSYIQI